MRRCRCPSCPMRPNRRSCCSSGSGSANRCRSCRRPGRRCPPAPGRRRHHHCSHPTYPTYPRRKKRCTSARATACLGCNCRTRCSRFGWCRRRSHSHRCTYPRHPTSPTSSRRHTGARESSCQNRNCRRFASPSRSCSPCNRARCCIRPRRSRRPSRKLGYISAFGFALGRTYRSLAARSLDHPERIHPRRCTRHRPTRTFPDKSAKLSHTDRSRRGPPFGRASTRRRPCSYPRPATSRRRIAGLGCRSCRISARALHPIGTSSPWARHTPPTSPSRTAGRPRRTRHRKRAARRCRRLDLGRHSRCPQRCHRRPRLASDRCTCRLGIAAHPGNCRCRPLRSLRRPHLRRPFHRRSFGRPCRRYRCSPRARFRPSSRRARPPSRPRR